MNDLHRLNLMMPGGGAPQDAVTGAVGVKTLLNKMTNGSFENDLETFTSSGDVAVTTNKPKYGTKSLELVLSNNQKFIQHSPSAINGHKYYYQVWAYINSGFTGNIGFYPRESAIPFSYLEFNSGITNQWQYISQIMTVTDADNLDILIGNAYAASTGTACIDGITLIDLTEAFGAGNEPTKEQMDAVMMALGGWFDGAAVVSSIPKGAYRKVGVSGYPEIVGRIGQIAGLPLTLAAGSELIAQQNIEKSTTSGTFTYTKVKELQLFNVKGTVRVSFNLRTGTTNRAAQGCIHINGVAVGTERIAPSNTYTSTYTEDFTINEGDLLQLYIRTRPGEDSATAHTAIFEVKSDIKLPIFNL